MSKGEVFNKANVQIDDKIFGKVYAWIFDDVARIAQVDGTVLAEMQGPIEIINASTEGAEWSNGTEHWIVTKVGCGCGGG